MKTIAKLSAYAVSIVFLYIAFKDMQFSLILSHLKHINIPLALVALLLSFCYLGIRGIYQKNNLRHICPSLPLRTSFSSVGMAQFYNSIFPARLGELVRTYFICKETSCARSSVLPYIVIEKIADLGIILAMLSIIVGFGFNEPNVIQAFMSFSAVVVALLFGLYAFVRFNALFIQILLRVSPRSIHEKIKSYSGSMVHGITCFRSVAQIGKSLGLLLLSWGIVAGMFWCLSYPYVQLLNLPPYAFIMLLVFSALSLSIPSAPSGIGVVHYGFFLAIRLMSTEAIESQLNMVGAFVVTLHFLTVLMDVIAGGAITLVEAVTSKEKRIDLSQALHTNPDL